MLKVQSRLVVYNLCSLPLVILGKSHYVLYGLVAAMQPRMLVTFDEELRPLPVSVRVGQVRFGWFEKEGSGCTIELGQCITTLFHKLVGQ